MDWVKELKPKDWNSLVGQDTVISLVKNALIAERLPHIIIFYGSSGGGKSSMAELLAKTLACDNNKTEPCGHCKSCMSLSNKIESNKVKKINIPELIKQADALSFINQTFKFQITENVCTYILEEFQELDAKMQTMFLEPLANIPDDIYIIICTTSLRSIDMAIRSRAFPLEIKRPSTKDCIDFLNSICDKKEISRPTADIAKIIVESCYNSPRDIVKFIQVLSCGEMTEDSVLNLFGGVKKTVLTMWFNTLHRAVNMSSYINYLKALYDDGLSYKKLFSSTSKILTDLLIDSENASHPMAKQYKVSETVACISNNALLHLCELSAEYNIKLSEESCLLYLLKMKMSLSNDNKGILSGNKAQADAMQSIVKTNAIKLSERESITSSKGQKLNVAQPLDILGLMNESNTTNLFGGDK